MISEQIEKCVIASAWIQDATQVTDTNEIYRIENIQSPFEHLNVIFKTQINEQKADDQIQKIYEFYRAKKISFRWYVFPHSEPANLNDRVLGLRPSKVTEMACLHADVGTFPNAIFQNVSVEELSLENLDEYCLANNDGWSMTGAAAEKLKLDVKKDLEKQHMGYCSFLARYQGEPASTGLLRIVGDAGYFLGGSTSHRFRNKGVYSALVQHRIQILKNMRIPTALVFAQKATSAPICIKLGFKLGAEAKSYSFSF